MKSLKRSLVFLMVFAMVLTTVAPVFAATPTDVVGTDYEDTVGKLVALGIINGYEDGTFKPDQDITRAEFSKIACYVIGVQTAADLSKGATKFQDVAAGHWASGYINIASEKGLLKGYPDGTFKPEAKVTYAEAITILVRALGLGPVVEGKGTWPANYLSKASEAGVTDDVSGLEGNAQAIRGNIAKLAWNTLTGEKWGEKEYTSTGVVYGPLGKTLLQEKYSDYVYKDPAADKFVPKFFEDVEVVKTQYVGGLSEDQVQLKYTGIATKLSITSTTSVPKKVEISAGTYSDDEIVVEVAEGIDTSDLVGKEVDVFFGKDNVVESLVVKSSLGQEGYMSVLDITLPDGTHNGKIELMGGTKYTLAEDVKAYVNFKDYTDADGNTDTLVALMTAVNARVMKVSVVLNSDGHVSTMNIFVGDAATGFNTQQFIVKDVESDGDVKSLQTGTTIFNLDDLVDVDKTTGYKTTFIKNGKKATSEDVKVGDVVTYIEINSDTYYVAITDNKVTGTVSEIYIDSDAVTPGNAAGDPRYKLTVGGKTYTMVSDSTARMTKTGDVEDKTVIDSTFTDFLGKEATLSLNAIGQVILVSGTITASSAAGEYAILTKDAWEGTAPDSTGKLPNYVELRTSTGEKRVFTVKGEEYKSVTGALVDSSAITEWDVADFPKGTLVRYSVNADGTIDASNIVNLGRIDDATGDTPASVTNLGTKIAGVTATVASVNDDAKSIKIGTTNYYYTEADTVIYNANVTPTEKNVEKVDGWDAVVSDSTTYKFNGSDVFVVYNTDTMIIKYLVVDVADYYTSDAKHGVLTQTQFSGLDSEGSQVWKIKVYTDGTEYTYTVATGVYDLSLTSSKYAAAAGDFVKYTLNADGKFVGGANDTERKDNRLVDKSVWAENKDGAYDKYVVKAVVGNLVTFNTVDGTTEAPLSLKSDIKVYDISGDTPRMASLSEVTAGCMVYGADQDGTTEQYGILVIVQK